MENVREVKGKLEVFLASTLAGDGNCRIQSNPRII